MIQKNDLAGSFTLPGTSMSVNRIGTTIVSSMTWRRRA
jgi:hypothetical protein